MSHGEVTSAGNLTQFHQIASLDDLAVFGGKTDIVLVAADIVNGDLGSEETSIAVILNPHRYYSLRLASTPQSMRMPNTP